MPSTSSPSPRNSAKARSTLSAFLDEIQTLAPSSASLRAAANPIPSVDAVTIAVLPESAYFYVFGKESSCTITFSTPLVNRIISLESDAYTKKLYTASILI